jgi:hypothetical protein
MEEWRYSSTFLDLALDGGEWSASLSYRFTPGERAPGTHWLGGWVNPRAGLDAMEKKKHLALSEIEPEPCSSSLYRLSYLLLGPVLYFNGFIR